MDRLDESSTTNSIPNFRSLLSHRFLFKRKTAREREREKEGEEKKSTVGSMNKIASYRDRKSHSGEGWRMLVRLWKGKREGEAVNAGR